MKRNIRIKLNGVIDLNEYIDQKADYVCYQMSVVMLYGLWL